MPHDDLMVCLIPRWKSSFYFTFRNGFFKEVWDQFLFRNLCLKKVDLLFQLMEYYFGKSTKIYQNETVSLENTEIKDDDLILPNSKKLRWRIRGEDERKNNNPLVVQCITLKWQKDTIRPEREVYIWSFGEYITQLFSNFTGTGEQRK